MTIALLLTSVATLTNSILIYSLIKRRNTKVDIMSEQTYFKLYFHYVGLTDKCASLEEEITRLKAAK